MLMSGDNKFNLKKLLIIIGVLAKKAIKDITNVLEK